MLGRLDDERYLCAECLFVDPVADIAVLGAPDSQYFYEESEAYEDLIESVPALTVRDIHGEGKHGWVSDAPAWVLSLDNKWTECKVSRRDRGYTISEPARVLRPGVSGSPVISGNGSVFGVATEGRDNAPASADDFSGRCSRLANDLPGWLLREML